MRPRACRTATAGQRRQLSRTCRGSTPSSATPSRSRATGSAVARAKATATWTGNSPLHCHQISPAALIGRLVPQALLGVAPESSTIIPEPEASAPSLCLNRWPDRKANTAAAENRTSGLAQVNTFSRSAAHGCRRFPCQPGVFGLLGVKFAQWHAMEQLHRPQARQAQILDIPPVAGGYRQVTRVAMGRQRRLPTGTVSRPRRP